MLQSVDRLGEKLHLMKNTIRPVKGTRDFYPEEMALRTWLYNQIRQVSESFGYQEFEGPLIEPIELYAAKSGEELVREQSFVFPDRGGNLITLRPELTPSLARLIAQRQRQLHFPVRWWSFGPMWRYEQPQKGRTREFFQWNIDLLGIDSPEADAEIVATGASFLQEVGLTPKDVHILVNNRRLMDQELKAAGIPEAIRMQAIRLIDRRDKLAPAKWEAYAAEIGLSPAQIDGLNNILENDSIWNNSEELVRFFNAIDALGYSEYVKFSTNIIRGLDYYTGTVFECFDTAGKYRAIFAGGRYDNLVADVGGDPLAGVGFAMGDKVVSLVLEEAGVIPDTSDNAQADVLVTTFSEETLLASLNLSSELRTAGLKVTCYPEIAKLGKQFKFADRIFARFAIVLGPDEIKQNQVAIKDLQSRDQVVVPRSEAVERIRLFLDQASPS